jgi:menaquinone-dependent protoporphyrinogen oxidase
MQNVLVVYASTHGHTGRIAACIADSMRSVGHHAELREVEDAADADPRDYGLVIVGASIHAGRHQPEAAEWVKRHAGTLNAMPSAFFSVSLTAAEDSDEARRVTADLAQQFEDETGWTPQKTATFGGALQYREYGFFTRRLIRAIAKRHGQSGDTSKDVDLTDWEAVETFAAQAAALACAHSWATGGDDRLPRPKQFAAGA